MPLDLDMEEIYQIFFEESAEGLDIMENGMLGLDLGAANMDVVNDIFRAAHSIKGGAATFGFLDISNFTHGVETLLDQVRTGERAVTEQFVEIQLASVDCIRGMIECLQNKEDIDTTRADEVSAKLKAMLSGDGSEAAPKAEPKAKASEARTPGTGEAASAEPSPPGKQKWQIQFAPYPDLLSTGNEPLNIFRELETLGRVTSQVDTSSIPSLHDINPEESYLAWSIELETEADHETIAGVFDWVSEQCDLKITAEVEEVAPSLPAAPPVAAEPVESAEAGETPNEKKPAPSVPGAAEKSAASPGGSAGRSGKNSGKEVGSIRVGIDKVDTLLNLVGELVITQSMLKRCADDYSPQTVSDLRDGLIELERHTRELQESAMQIRMLPISVSFSRFPRLVRDMSSKLGKKVELKFSGEHTELDKTVLEKMSDPLVHLVRNSLDHGIETPDIRLAAGKPETGTLTLKAYHDGGNIVIRVEDDGAGLNRDRILGKAIERGLVAEGEAITDDRINALIFHPGFSTAEQVSDLSGRGVGMDVVRRNIKDLGGRIDVFSEVGKGSAFSICLPLTLAILDGQLVRVGSQVYIFSLLSIVETIQVEVSELNHIVGSGNVYRMRDDYIPVVRLREAFGLEPSEMASEGELLVVVESDGNKVGLFVDDLLDQQQVVIKSLEENYKQVEGLAGATILGDGTVALILDVAGLINSFAKRENTPLALAESAA